MAKSVTRDVFLRARYGVGFWIAFKRDYLLDTLSSSSDHTDTHDATGPFTYLRDWSLPDLVCGGMAGVDIREREQVYV